MADSFWDLFTGTKRIESLFDPEQILTISIVDYLASREKKCGDYSLQGVHYFGTNETGFRKAVPKGAEVVVGYRSSIIPLSGFFVVDVCFDRYGTVLIPKGFTTK